MKKEEAKAQREVRQALRESMKAARAEKRRSVEALQEVRIEDMLRQRNPRNAQRLAWAGMLEGQQEADRRQDDLLAAVEQLIDATDVVVAELADIEEVLIAGFAELAKKLDGK